MLAADQAVLCTTTDARFKTAEGFEFLTALASRGKSSGFVFFNWGAGIPLSCQLLRTPAQPVPVSLFTAFASDGRLAENNQHFSQHKEVPMHLSLTAMLLAISLGGGADDLRPLQGKWKVVAVFEDGQSLQEKDIASHLFADGTISIDGPVISFLALGAFEPKKLAFTVDAKAEPKAIDLVGASKVGSRGIYLAAGDSLMVCLPAVNENARPLDFGAGKGTGRTLLVFKRFSAKEPQVINATLEPARKVPQLPQAPTAGDEMRKALIGTWGHQNDDAVNYYTLNSDGTFSAVIEWKNVLKRTFNDDVRSSGTWRLNNGVIVATVTASTDANLRNQVYSWRITNLGSNDLIAVDGQGRLRHEWRVR
jgi:uncharacterized protein (TIGR03067 family)